MKKLVLSVLLVSLFSGTHVFGQDTLPKFSVKNVGSNRIIISWVNTFESIKQISIQRSFDSLTGYRSILTVADPTTPQNGYLDTKATNDHMFYRLYIQLDKGVYLFSKAQKPVIDSFKKSNGYNDRLGKMTGNDSLSIPNFGMNNKDRPELFTPSNHVYTYKDGSVRINLPDDENKKYSIKFFDSDSTFLFELKEIKERTFRLDKSNFFHAGWFRFELYEDGRLIEKYKFYLQKDF